MFAIAADKLGFSKRGTQQKLSLGSFFTAGCSILGGLIILRYLLELTSSLFHVIPHSLFFPCTALSLYCSLTSYLYVSVWLNSLRMYTNDVIDIHDMGPLRQKPHPP